MERSSYTLLLLIVLAGLSVFFLQEKSINPQELFEIKNQFDSFKLKFNRKYSNQEELFRFKIFKENIQMINKHNLDPTKTYKMGITKFADLTNEEFVQKVLNPDLQKLNKQVQFEPFVMVGNPPLSVDWRGKNVITPVVDQGDCGSSWTFSATGTVQSVLAVKNKTLLNLSKQQLLDCCTYAKYGCQGCKGAFPDWALSYANDAGLVLDSEYPFTVWKDSCKPIPTAKKYLDHKKPFSIIVNNTASIKNALAEFGPLSVSVDAYKWQFYVSGIYNDCHDDHVTLAVLLVGYDEQSNWIVRNSWGTTWGEQGYMRLTNKSTACLLRTHVVVPHLAA